MLKQYGMLGTKHSRAVGGQGVPGNCIETLLGQMEGLDWRIVTRDGNEKTDETDFYMLLMENARDENGAVIGGSGLFSLLGQDILTTHEGGNVEIVRIRGGRYDGVPIALYAMDGSTVRWKPRSPGDDEPIVQVGEDSIGKELARFRTDEVMHSCWRRYMQRGLQWYNRHPIQVAWVALNCLAAGDDYNYSLLTEVVPQGILDLGDIGRDEAMQWRDAWKAARRGGKLDDIAILWGSKSRDPKFLKFNEQLQDQPFQHMAYWYLTIVTGSFGMSPLDIGFMTQLNTKAGAEVSAELSRNKGLSHLLQVIKKAVELWILPEHLSLAWPDLDPSDEQVEAETRRMNTEALVTALAGGLVDLPEARAEAVRLRVFDIDAEDVEGIGETDVGKASYVAKSHVARVVEMLCPLCKVVEVVDVYDDHGGLCVCRGCGCTFDPEVVDGYDGAV
jgi:hypothetical protein